MEIRSRYVANPQEGNEGHNGCIQEIVETAYENGINMFDVAESYARGKSEEEL